MTVKKKATKTPQPKEVKAKALPKPKFGEVGYEFNIKAKIVEVSAEDDPSNWPYIVKVDLGDFEDIESISTSTHSITYRSKQCLVDAVAHSVPSLIKTLKQEELDKAKAEVARLTKELAEIK